MASNRVQDCIDTLGGDRRAESLCRELEQKTKGRRLLPMRGLGSAPGGPLVFKADMTANGWRPTNGKTWKKSIGDRTAIIVKRDDKFRVLLIRYNLHHLPHNGRLTFASQAAAVDIAERFLNGDQDFDPIANGGGEIRRNRESMSKPESLRSIVRRSVGIGSKPRIQGPLRRVNMADDCDDCGGDLAGVDLTGIVNRALEPIRRDIDRLAAQVGGAPVASNTPRRRPDYDRLQREHKAGRLKARAKPAPRSPGYIMRTVPNSFDASTGKPQRRLTVRSAVRRSLGLPYRPPTEFKGYKVRDAMRVEDRKALQEGVVRGMSAAGKRPLTERSGGIVDPITGLRFVSREAYRQWLEVNRPDPKRGVPFHTPK